MLAPDGKPLEARSSSARSELTWAFTPAEPWKAGADNLVAFAMLEDLAGNRIGRAFEVDQFDRTDKSGEPEKTLIPFQSGKDCTESLKHRSTDLLRSQELSASSASVFRASCYCSNASIAQPVVEMRCA